MNRAWFLPLRAHCIVGRLRVQSERLMVERSEGVGRTWVTLVPGRNGVRMEGFPEEVSFMLGSEG